MLRQRVATGVAVALAFLVALFALPATYLSAISATVLVFAAWEWAALAGVADQRLRTGFTAIVGLGSFVVWWLLVERTLLTQSFMLGLFALGVLLWLLLLAAVIKYPASSILLQSVRARLVLGVLVLLLASTGFTFLSVHPLGKFWIVYAIAIVVVADVGAYFSGKRFGRRKLAPQVSPGKSWEGFWGGFVAAQLLAAVFYLWVWDIFNKLGAPPALEANTTAIAALDFEMNFGSLETASIILFVVVAGLLSAASVLGDLFESVLKRNVGVKDSGNLLPGHGGILDRVDGMLPSVPLLAFFVLLLRW